MLFSGEQFNGVLFQPVLLLMALPTSILAGWVSDHWGRKGLVYISGVMMAIVCLIFIFLQNPFAPARLSDDEIAIAISLSKMQTYVEGGPDFYSLAEAAQDHYLSIMIEYALALDSTVKTTLQPWAE